MKSNLYIINTKTICFLISCILVSVFVKAEEPKGTASLHVKKEGSQVCLKWDVVEKEIPKMFLVEKSNDGIRFEAIGIRETTNERSYSFCDEEPGDKIALYRIMKVESKNKVWVDQMNEVNITPYTNSEQVSLSVVRDSKEIKLSKN